MNCEKWQTWSNLIFVTVSLLTITQIQGGRVMHDGHHFFQNDDLLPMVPSELNDLHGPYHRVSKYLGQYRLPQQDDLQLDDYQSPFYQCILNGNAKTNDLSNRDYYHCKQESDVSGLFSVYKFTCPLGTVFDDKVNACNYSPSKSKGLLHDNSMLANSGNRSLPVLQRKKRFAFTAALAAIGTLASAANGIAGAVISAKKKKNFAKELMGIENKLDGIHGKLEGVQLSILESQNENRINAAILHNLIVQQGQENNLNFGITQDLINEGILENRIHMAAIQGLIKQGNTENQLNFVKVQVSIGELKEFISGEIFKLNSEIKSGFDKVTTEIEKARIEPIVSNLLNLVKEYNLKLNHLDTLRKNTLIDEIARSDGFLEYLESSQLSDEINNIINQKFAIPKSSSDVSSVFVLDLLVSGLQVHTNMLSQIISSNVLLAVNALKEKHLDNFNKYMARVSSSVSSVELSLMSNKGLIGKVRDLLNNVETLPYASNIDGLDELLIEKNNILDDLENDINDLIFENLELDKPGTIKGKIVFRSPSISVPVGSWKTGSKVSYAIQLLSDEGMSRIGDWSAPYTIENEANPSFKLPRVRPGTWRAVYRKFDNEEPECVGIIKESRHNNFRDIGRDILNAARRPNEEIAVKEMNLLLNDGDANVEFYIEDKMTPLHYAANSGNVEVMKILIDNGADIQAKASEDQQCLHFAALFGSADGINYLVDQDAIINAQTKTLGLSPLHIAVANGNSDATRALIAKGAFVNIKDNNGMTPLHISVTGKGDTIDVLLENEAIDVNAVDENGLTPLHYAARSLNDVFVRKLLQHPNIDNTISSDSKLLPLHLACMSGKANLISNFIQHGVSLKTPDQYGYTPLHYAAYYGNKEAVLLLLQSDESLKDIKNNDGKTARNLGIENNQETIVEILTSDQEKLIQLIQEEMDDQPSPSEEEKDPFEYETLSNCSDTQIVDKMAIGSEETCARVGDVDAYVNLVIGMIPLQVYYETNEEFSQIFSAYDYDLGVAQDHAKIWRNGESIVKGIRETFALAREFEPEFKRKYKINQERVGRIREDADQEKQINETKEAILKLNGELQEVILLLEQPLVETVKTYMDRKVKELETDIAKKNKSLSEDFTLIHELNELVGFLEFVQRDSSKIKDIAVKTRTRIETFKDHLEHDKTAFARHGRIASETFETMQEETIKKNAQLAENKQRQETLEQQIEQERKDIKAKFQKINEAHAHLREIRRNLIKKMKKNKTLKIIGAILTPLLIGIPLLVHASKEEKVLVQTLQSEVTANKEEVDLITVQVENSRKEMETLRGLIANNSANTDMIKSEMNTFITLDGDLNILAENVETLLEAIEKAIAGVALIKDVFDDVTKKLGEMITVAKEAKTEADRINAKYFIYNDLSKLECNWKDVYLKVMSLDECTRAFKILH